MRFLFLTLFVYVSLLDLSHAETVMHPLDGLTAAEIERAANVVAAAGHVDEQTLFSMIVLQEPPKAEVRAWQPGEPFTRTAFVTLQAGNRLAEAVVDLDRDELVSYADVPDAQGVVTLQEFIAAQTATLSSERWQEAMRRRGYETFDNIFCGAGTPGWFGEEHEPYGDRRRLQIYYFDKEGTANNARPRPIEGLFAVYDVAADEIIDVVDHRQVTVPDAGPLYDESEQAVTRPAIKPVIASAPHGANVVRNGRVFAWDNWRFHLRFDERVGTVISLVDYVDRGLARSIAYQIAVSEMFVPYMDPDPSWYWRTFMDAGEYTIGGSASRLRAGIDCPDYADFLGATAADEFGEPMELEDVICVFERNTLDPAWRHDNTRLGIYEARPEVELVVRMVSTIGNYDYVLDYVFLPRGQIRIDVGATGIDAVKGVETRSMADPEAAEDTAYGALVAPNVVAVYHDHFISFRLDLDVDGIDNTLILERIVATAVPDGPRTSIWQLVPEQVEIEGPLEQGHAPEVWRVANPNKATGLGHRPGYQIEPDHTVVSLLSADDYPQRRAAFSAAPLWVTRYAPGELFAGGDYPNQSKGGDGLPVYASGEPVTNTDIVLWYTMGFHHITRAEDWPVLPTKWHSVRLRLYNFFDQNPSIDLPSSFLEPSATD